MFSRLKLLGLSYLAPWRRLTADHALTASRRRLRWLAALALGASLRWSSPELCAQTPAEGPSRPAAASSTLSGTASRATPLAGPEAAAVGAAEEQTLRGLSDPTPTNRLAALESLEQTPPSPSVRAFVNRMAEADENPLVRGRARILLADWSLLEPSVPRSLPGRNPAGPNTPRQASPSIPRPASRSQLEEGRVAPRVRPSAAPVPADRPPNFTRSPALPQDRNAAFRPRPSSVIPDPVFPSEEGAVGFTRVEPVSGELPPAPAPFRGGVPGGGLEPSPLSVDLDDPLFQLRDPEEELEESLPGLPGSGLADLTRPPVLSDPVGQVFEGPRFEPPEGEVFVFESDEPLGFSGPSGVLPTEEQESSHFVPIEDRWRVGIPPWDRYATPTPLGADAPFELGQWWNPYRQHLLKGDYPIYGQHTFLNITAANIQLHEFRQVPTPTTPFESTAEAFQEDFFGDPNQYLFVNYLRLKLDLFHGNAAFKPVDWRFVLEPVFNMNYLKTHELAVVNPDVRKGTDRFRTFMALEQWFIETKLADLSPHYDFVSLRAGSQPFVSDFRGFIFSDINRAVRIFGTREANRDQFNLAVFSQQEKDTNSFLNTFDDRDQTIFIANYYRQDFIFPGYTAQGSVHYNHDEPTIEFDENDFLVRPDPAGNARPHQVDAVYLGFSGEGHIERFNIAHAFYWALGRDTCNPLAGQETDINAQMAAIELSYDRDWVRFRGSYFFASGDSDIRDDQAEGFDAIFDNPNFAGGQFSYWQRQAIKLFGVNLVQRESLLPNLRSSKVQGQSNFVNPGLNLFNLGMDFEVTPKVRVITNANYLWFDKTETLEQFVFQSDISREIGVDLSIGTEYRPLLNDNVIVLAGFSSLLPGRGFKDLYEQADPLGLFPNQDTQLSPLLAAFMEVSLTF